MKNPFVKRHNGAIALSVALGTVAAGAAAYLFLTEKGTGIRQRIRERITSLFSRAQEEHVDPTAYLKKPHKVPKSDREALLKHGPIIEHPEMTGND